MAREEADREDLLGEATAYVERIEWELAEPGLAYDRVFVGFRRDHGISFYFGADPVYHFNAAGELRRAFRLGRLIKAEIGRLVAMERVRSEDEVALMSTEFTSDETVAFCRQAIFELSALRAALQNHRVTLVGQIPEMAPIESRVIAWLETHPEIVIAKSARVGG